MHTELFIENKFDQMTAVNIITLIWCITAFFTSILISPSVSSVRHNTLDVRNTFHSSQKLLMCAIGLSAISISFNAAIYFKFGSIAGVTVASKISKELSGSFVYLTMASLATCITMLAFFVHYEQKKGPKNKALYCCLSVLVAVNFLILFAWGNRYFIALLSLIFVISFHFNIRKFNFFEILFIVCIMIGVLQGLKLVRWYFITQGLDSSAKLAESFWRSISTSLHLNRYDSFALALQDAGKVFPFRNGQDFLNGARSILPSFIYDQKESFHIGGWFVKVYLPNRINGWPVSVIGSWYVNFGYLGVLAGAGLSAFMATIFDNLMLKLRSHSIATFLATVFGLLVFEGGVDTGFILRTFTYGASIIFILLICRKRHV